MHHGIAGGTFQRAMIQQVIWDQLTGHQINSQRPVVCTVRILCLLQDLEIPSQGRIGAEVAQERKGKKDKQPEPQSRGPTRDSKRVGGHERSTPYRLSSIEVLEI